MKTLPYHTLVIYAIIIYGAITELGGIIGFIQAKSKASLIAGSISGGLLIVSGILIHLGMIWAVYLALLISFTLAMLFSKRYSEKRKFMPAGLMLVLSTVMSAFLITIVVMQLLFGNRF